MYRRVEIEHTLNYAWSRSYQKFWLCIDGYKLKKTVWRNKWSNKKPFFEEWQTCDNTMAKRKTPRHWYRSLEMTLVVIWNKNIYYTGFYRNASCELTLVSTFILLSPVRYICPRGCNAHPSPSVVSVFGTYMVY